MEAYYTCAYIASLHSGRVFDLINTPNTPIGQKTLISPTVHWQNYVVNFSIEVEFQFVQLLGLMIESFVLNQQ